MPEINIKQYLWDYDYDSTHRMVEVKKSEVWTNHIVIDGNVYDIEQLQICIDLIKKFSN